MMPMGLKHNMTFDVDSYSADSEDWDAVYGVGQECRETVCPIQFKLPSDMDRSICPGHTMREVEGKTVSKEKNESTESESKELYV